MSPSLIIVSLVLLFLSIPPQGWGYGYGYGGREGEEAQYKGYPCTEDIDCHSGYCNIVGICDCRPRGQVGCSEDSPSCCHGTCTEDGMCPFEPRDY